MSDKPLVADINNNLWTYYIENGKVIIKLCDISSFVSYKLLTEFKEFFGSSQIDIEVEYDYAGCEINSMWYVAVIHNPTKGLDLNERD